MWLVIQKDEYYQALRDLIIEDCVNKQMTSTQITAKLDARMLELDNRCQRIWDNNRKRWFKTEK